MRRALLALVALPAAVAAGAAGPGLRYVVEPAQAEMVLGERVGLKLRLFNDGDQPVTVFWPGDPWVDVFRFEVLRWDGAKVAPPLGPSAPIPVARRFKAVLPRQHLQYYVIWSCPRSSANCQEWRLTEPGDYIVRPTFAAVADASVDPETGEATPVPGAWLGTVDAEPVFLAVKPPAADPKRGSIAVQGEVVDQAGKPIRAARVVASRQTTSMGSRDGFAMVKVETRFTDAEGRFAFAHLPDDSPFLVLESTHPDHRRSAVRLIPAPPKTDYKARIEMAPGATVRGTVRDPDGKALAGVRVSDGGEYNKLTYTDARGRFELRGVGSDGAVRCHFWKEAIGYAHVSATEAQAAKGDWTVTLAGPRHLGIGGLARFADGAPVAGQRLEFHLRGSDGKSDHVACRTQADGRFKVRLPKADTFSATVWTQGGERGGVARPRWRTTVEGIAPRRKDLEIVFENWCVLEASVEPAGPLPPALEFRVNCSMACAPGERWEAVATTALGAHGGLMLLGDLSPGRYRVEVEVQRMGHWRWSREVAVGGEGQPRKAKVSFPLPELPFGSLRARVLEPDGKTAARGASASVHPVAFGPVAVRDGQLVAEQVPARTTGLTVRRGGGVSAHVTCVVQPGATTDLGDVVLRPRAPQGFVEGRLLYDDGTPVLGATTGWAGAGEPAKLGGAYRVRRPAGRARVSFDLAGAIGWPRPPRGAVEPIADPHWPRLGRRWSDHVVVQVDIPAGEALRRDIVLPRKALRSIEVHAPLQRRDGACVGVVVKGEGYWLNRFGWPRWQQDDFAIADAPAADTLVILRAPEYYGWARVPADDPAPRVAFDPAAAGTIQGRAVRPNGQPAARVSLALRPAPDGWVTPGDDPADVCLGLPGNVDCGRPTAADGSFQLAALRPGKYLVYTPQPGTSKGRVVEVAGGKETVVELTTTAVATGPPPLRELPDAPDQP